MKQLPLASGREHCKTLESIGWVVVRSEKNHFVLTKPDRPGVLLAIPDHREVARGLLLKEVKAAGIAPEEYAKLFRSKRARE